MRRGGFTLIEMMLALSISAVMLAAIVGLLASVWTIAKESSDELQSALRARNIREQLFYSLADETGKQLGYGLVSATNIVYDGSSANILAYPPNENNTTNTWETSKSAVRERYAIDTGRNLSEMSKVQSFEYVFLKVALGKTGKPGAAVYHDRLVIPKFGSHPECEDISNAVGGGEWKQPTD